MALGEWRKRFLGLAPRAASVCAAVAVMAGAASPAQAHWRHHFHYARHRHVAWVRPVYHGGSGVPAEVEASKYSAIVVDANTGREIWGVNENALRHPASLTKVMTLFMLFEELDKGALTLSSRVPISEHAANQEPSKLGVPAGDSISVEEAIKAIVTRSANDVAVAVAEKIGGTESNFAALMTHRAHEIGMSRTLYRDASGLPNDEQLTTAHDLALLGETTQKRFPQYFHYFSLREFNYDGQTIGNHDHLLGRVDGVDGIKTGYTRGSGFNLLTSMHRDGRSLVAVVMGGISGPSRDRLMARLIESHYAEASVGGATTRVAEAAPVAEAFGRAPPPRAAVEREETAAVAPPVRDAEPQGEGDDSDGDTAPAARPLKPTKPNSALLAKATALDPGKLGWRTGPQARALVHSPPAHSAKDEETRVARASDDNNDSAGGKKGGWSVQVGATDNAAQARHLLARAKSRHHALASARAITEKVRRDGDTLYRVRFAGLDSAAAQKACRDLRHGGLDCFTTRE
jgi:D-alanyl-D-alanine carboxypeptidase